jgi:undecaprenyl-diphosphatase
MLAALLAGVDPTVAAYVLAVVQGITEFLPISSDGHLVIVQSLLGQEGLGLAFDVALHLGTLFAVVWVFRKDLLELLRDCLAGRLQLLVWLFVASLPAAVIGLLLEHWIEETFQSVKMAGAGLLVTAVVLLFGERSRRARAKGPPTADPPLRMSDAILMGFAQAFAILPGVSRSASTISVGLMRGLGTAQAARLSFLMSVPVVAGANLLELPKVLESGFAGLSRTTVIGAVLVSGLVGWASLSFLLAMLSRGAFRWFAMYCTLVGALVLAFL